MSECEIDGVRYPLAEEKNEVPFRIIDTGEALLETWNDWHLGLGATDHIPGMYYFSTGGDASRFGQIRAPLAYTASALGQTRSPHAYYFAAQGPVDAYIYRIQKPAGGGFAEICKFSADMSTLYSTVNTLGSLLVGTPGRPAFWGGLWYVPVGVGLVYRLTTIGVGAAADTWTVMAWQASNLSTFTSGGTAKIARSFNASGGDGGNQVALATAAPLLTTDPGSWASPVSVGDTSTSITDMVENQGLLFVAKEDNLYEFDSDSIARPVLPFGYRVGVDAENGKGMLAFADMIFYPSIGGLWRYRVGASARPVGIDTIGGYSDVPNPTGPIRFRHRGLTNIGEWIWMIYESGGSTYPVAARLRRPDDPPGHEFVWHIPASATGNPGKAIFATSAHRLIIQSASDSASLADKFLPLGADGSPASFTGTRGTGGQTVFGETNFGRPTKRKQLKAVYIDIDTAGSVSVNGHRDGAAADVVGTVTAAGLSVVNPTPGTNDKMTRYRPSLQFNDNTAVIRSLTVEARTPSIYRVVIEADDDSLNEYGLTSEDARINLMRLVNKGLTSIIGPGGVRDMTSIAGTPTAWQGYVEKMTDTVYQSDKGIGRGIEVLISRYTTDGN